MSRPPARILLAVLLLPLLGAVGCRSSFRRLDYGPQPLTAVVQPAGASEALARVLLSVQGVRYEDEGYRLELRIRVENRSAGEIELMREELVLVARSLETFGRPRIVDLDDPAGPPTVPAGEVRTFELSFPFPPDADDVDLNGLNLRWGLRHGAGEEVLSTTFERIVSYGAYDSSWHLAPSIFFGFGG